MSEVKIEIISKATCSKCIACISYVVPPRIKLEDNPIYAGDYCKNQKSPYFMRKPSGRCDCFNDEVCKHGESDP
jgi:hypothetical protein